MKSTKNYLIEELSVFYPCYNVEEVLPKVVKKTVEVLNKITPKWEIILIEDGSKDNTKIVIDKLAKKYPNIRPLYHPQNWGYGGTIKQGLFNSRYQWVTFTDSDGQFDFSEITKLITAKNKHQVDVVLGYRIKRVDPPIRSLIAYMLKVWNFIWFGFHGVKDVDCAFKLINKKILDQIGHLKTDSAITTTELLIRIQRLGYKWTQVGVHHYERKYGQQTGSNFKVMKRAAVDSINLFKALH